MHGVVILPPRRVEVSRFAPNSGRFRAPSMSGYCNEFGRDYTNRSELIGSRRCVVHQLEVRRCGPHVRHQRAAIPCAT
jgi:hypothetical protein